ncbi:MAG: 30S ribosomal protein S2, partial [Malacoplasma sp.]
VKDESRRSSSFYINERWLGGTLTNFKTINNSIKKFNSLLVMQKFGEIDKYNKKEKVEIKKETEKLAKFFGGIRMLKELPQVLILTDPENEKNALLEARKLSIPIIAICNSNATPEGIDYVIPANNYSIKTVYLLIGILVDAICEGKDLPKNYVGKNDDEIVFPEIVKKRPEYIRVVNHRNNYTNR